MNIVENIIVEDKIFTLRGIKVMIDKDLAELYKVETRRLNEQVKRNIEKFPGDFMFELNENEQNELIAK
ncbi:MAG: ORF6N domain-containing protein [Campylobacterota bacterium]|nr:ORF6N domain-containing protein [Campylobacterota bacterium]